MRHTRSLIRFLALAAFLPVAFADDVTGDPGSDDSPPPPEVIEDIAYAADIVPGSAEFELLPRAAQALLFTNHRIQAAVVNGRVAAFYGAPLATGATAAEAEQVFWTAHADAFGVTDLDLLVTRFNQVGLGRFTVYAYQQRIGGLPVEYAPARLVVRNGETPSVAWASGKFVPPPVGGLPPVLVTPDEAIAAVLAMSEYATLSVDGAPQLVVYAGTEDDWANRVAPPVMPVPAWKFRALNLTEFRATAFFVGAESGELVHTRDETYEFDVTGTVQGWASPWGPNAASPDIAPNIPGIPQNPPALKPIPGIRVVIEQTSASAFTNSAGQFSIPHSDTTAITVRASVADGLRANVVHEPDPDNPQVDELVVSVTHPDPALPVSLILNDLNPPPYSDIRFGTAQVNALIHAHLAHDFIVERSGWPGLDTELTLRVNLVPTCGFTAYAGTGINFYQHRYDDPGPIQTCANHAFSSIVAHEYGHFVVNQLGLTQGAFGEGFGDTLSILLYDDAIVGRNMNSYGSHVRNYEPGQAEKLYPCATGIHDCGRVLAGFWRDVLERCRANIGPNDGQFEDDADALEFVRQRFVDWSFITVGGAGSNAAHPLTAKEVLIVSDDDGNIFNGTPHSTEICSAARDHALVNPNFLYVPPGSPNPYCGKTPAGTNEVISFHPPIVTYTSAPGSLGIDPFGITVADLNPPTPPAVGLKDVVLVCEGASAVAGSCQIRVYLAQSSASDNYTFAAAQILTLPDGSTPAKVVLADMAIPNHPADGKPDIVVTLPGSNSVRIYYNQQGSGTFSSDPGEYLERSTVTRPIGLAVADWDNANGNDIAMAGYMTEDSVNHPAIGFQWSQGGGSYNAASIALSAPGKGYDLHAWDQGTTGSPVHRLAITNEVLDTTLPPNNLKNYVTVYFHTGGQSFGSPQSLETTYPSRAVTTGSVTVGDALPDLICTTFGTGTNRIAWFKQRTDGSTLFETPPASPPNWVAALGLNPLGIAAGKLGKLDTTPPLQLDSKVDLLEATPVPDTITSIYSRLQLFRNTGSATTNLLFNRDPDLFYIPVDFDVNRSSFSRQVVVVDVNGDELPDVLTANRGQVGDDESEGFTVLLNRAFGG